MTEVNGLNSGDAMTDQAAFDEMIMRNEARQREPIAAMRVELSPLEPAAS